MHRTAIRPVLVKLHPQSGRDGCRPAQRSRPWRGISWSPSTEGSAFRKQESKLINLSELNRREGQLAARSN